MTTALSLLFPLSFTLMSVCVYVVFSGEGPASFRPVTNLRSSLHFPRISARVVVQLHTVWFIRDTFLETSLFIIGVFSSTTDQWMLISALSIRLMEAFRGQISMAAQVMDVSELNSEVRCSLQCCQEAVMVVRGNMPYAPLILKAIALMFCEI